MPASSGAYGPDRQLKHTTRSRGSGPVDPPDDVRTTAELKTRHRDDRQPMLNQYLSKHRVGHGQHGEVILCYDVTKERYVAIKAVKRSSREDKQLRNPRRLPSSAHTPYADKIGVTEHKIRKEIAIMKKCRHGNVVRLLEVIDDRLKSKIYMVMEYLGGGEVKWKNSNQEPVQTVDQTRRIIRDAILGLEYLHYQGIIHRDIKPANLLWTTDRSSVKITDFGVSHFSYAQRLAAAGNKGDDNPLDPILLDDSDLSKTAGTPSFLAPEVLFDSSSEASPPIPSSSNNFASLPFSRSNTHVRTASSAQAPASRPPITKAIDVWALGVTLYCLLFGRPPFEITGENNHVWQLYRVICHNDWTPDESMGFDKVPTGGRFPIKPHGFSNTMGGSGTSRNAEGYIVMTLLDRILQKDPKRRISLDDVKRYPWITRDISDPLKWIAETSPMKADRVHVSDNDAQTAMSNVHFRWNWGKKLTHQLSSLLRTARTKSTAPAKRSQRESDHETTGSRSMPGSIRRNRTTHTYVEAVSGLDLLSKEPTGRRDKGKQRADSKPTKPSFPNPTRSKSIERWPMRDKTLPAPIQISSTAPSAKRRGSEAFLAPPPPPNNSASSSPPYPSPPSSSYGEGSSKSRGGFPSIWHWRFNKFSSHGTTSPADTVPSTPTAQPESPRYSVFRLTDRPLDPLSRRSEEALRNYPRFHRYGHQKAEEEEEEPSNAPLTAARRASSWGENPSDFDSAEELVSLNSEAHDIDKETMLVGAGGVVDLPPDGGLPNEPITFARNPFSVDIDDILNEPVDFPSRDVSPFDSGSRCGDDTGSEDGAVGGAGVGSGATREGRGVEDYLSRENFTESEYGGCEDDYSSSFGSFSEAGEGELRIGLRLDEDRDHRGGARAREEEESGSDDTDEEIVELEVRRRGPGSPRGE